MKSSIFFVLAAIAGLFALALGFDMINFSTDRADGRVLLLSVALLAALAVLGVKARSKAGKANAANSVSVPEGPGEDGTTKQGPSAVVLDLDQGADTVEATPIASEAIEAKDLAEPVAAFAETYPSKGDRSIDSPTRVLVAADAPSDEVVDPIEDELRSIIDDEQMLEITDLVAAAEAEAAGHQHDGTAASAPESDTAERDTLVPATDTVQPLRRLELRLADYDDEDLQRVLKESEAVVIAEMVRNGQLSSAGELTQQDIASMVFLAYTTEEMLNELRLRKAMDAPSLDTPADFVPLDTTD